MAIELSLEPLSLEPHATVKEKEIGAINTPRKKESSLPCIEENSEEILNQLHVASVSNIFTKEL